MGTAVLANDSCHPQTYGYIESMHFIKYLFFIYILEEGNESAWFKFASFLKFDLYNNVSNSISSIPFNLVFGWEFPIPTDDFYGLHKVLAT